MAASLKARFGDDAEIKPGKSGQFDVIVDGRLIFSKADRGRFPLDNEVEEIYQALRDGRPIPDTQSSATRPSGFLRRMASKLHN